MSSVSLTHMTSRIPVWLRVKVTGVHSVVGRVDPEKLPLVQSDQLERLQLQDLVHDGFVKGRHLPAVGQGCRSRRRKAKSHTEVDGRQWKSSSAASHLGFLCRARALIWCRRPGQTALATASLFSSSWQQSHNTSVTSVRLLEGLG